MKILFDHNVDRRLRRHLPGHVINTTRERRWEGLDNGHLIRAAVDAGFDVLLSIDKNIEHQQNLPMLPLPIVVLDSVSNSLPFLVKFAPAVLLLLASPLTPALYLIAPDGSARRLTSPR